MNQLTSLKTTKMQAVSTGYFPKKIIDRLSKATAILVLGGISLLPILANAQTTTLKLKDVINKGLEQSKMLKVSKAKSDLATAKHESINDNLLPNVRASLGFNNVNEFAQPVFTLPGSTHPISLLSANMGAYIGQASVNEAIFEGFKFKYARQSAIYLEEAGKLDYQNDRQDVVLNITNAYYNIYKIKATKKTLEESLRQSGEHLNDVKSYEKQGIATHNDVLKVQLQQSNLKLALIDIDNALKTSLFNMNIMLGLGADAKTDIDTVIASQATQNAGYAELEQKMMSRNDLKAGALKLKASESSVNGSRSAYYPDFSVGANYYYINPSSRFVPAADSYFSIWTLGATISYNITGAYTTKHKTNEANIQLTQMQASVEQLTDAAKMEVNQTYLAYVQSREKVEVANESVQQAEENYKIVKSKYRNQVALLTDLLDADLALLQARINLTNAKADAEVSYYKVQKASGQLNY
jgi:outer membrane protein